MKLIQLVSPIVIISDRQDTTAAAGGKTNGYIKREGVTYEEDRF
jgi:hypothetical protein